MFGLLKTWRELEAKGIMGINRRNADYVLKHNKRSLYPLVDDKILTKERAIIEGINVPEMYGIISSEREIRHLDRILENHNDFVIKPAQGAGGDGIIVIADRFEGRFKTVSGKIISQDEIEYQISNILTGLYSLGGGRDRALIEYRVSPDPIFKSISYEGVPDIRIIVLMGYPIMAMLRLPTRQSGGKANLHQGAIGVGVDLATGITLQGTWLNAKISKHPDTSQPVAGVQLPYWTEFMTLAANCYELCGLGYIGVDMVLDQERGPLILELNARPGLNIQIANNAGLTPRAHAIEDHVAQLKQDDRHETPQQRVQLVQDLFSVPSVTACPLMPCPTDSDLLYPLPYFADSSQRFALIHHEPGAVLLDSGQPGSHYGRYDICSAWPVSSIRPDAHESSAHFLQRARDLLQQLPTPANLPEHLPFAGGLLGYVSYHFHQPHSQHQPQLPRAQVGLYNWALITDHQQRSSYLFCHPSLSPDTRQRLQQRFQTLPQPAEVTEAETANNTPAPLRLTAPFQAELPTRTYQAAIQNIQHQIHAGHCQQANYTQRWFTHYSGDPWPAYLSIRQQCPTPFAAFVRLSATEAILSASPERFLSVDQQQVEARPIKGTRSRGHTASEDLALANELQHSAKDLAENRMIVDVQRQEFMHYCHPDSVHLSQDCGLESYPNVHHLVSVLHGQLTDSHDPLDLFLHSFPGASITGTPKQPVIQLIDTLEASAREIYCGAIFYLDSRGQFDSSVCIRTLLAHNQQLSCWGGGGITQASDWHAEYRESHDKVQALMDALAPYLPT